MVGFDEGGVVRRVLLAVVFAALAAVGGLGASFAPSGSVAARPKPAIGIHKIKHVIVIMQENRSFDQLFRHVSRRRRHPAMANGSSDGVRAEPGHGQVRQAVPRHARSERRRPARPGERDRRHQRRQDGRLRRERRAAKRKGCTERPEQPDLLSTCDSPTSWATTTRATSRTTGRTRETSCCRITCSSRTRPGACPRTCSWSRSGPPKCTNANDPISCTNALAEPGLPPGRQQRSRGRVPPNYAWTDLTYLLHKRQVSWGYYVFSGTEPDCEDDAMICESRHARTRRHRASGTRCRTSTRCSSDDQTQNIVSVVRELQRREERERCPRSSWIDPTGSVSEHPPGTGQRRARRTSPGSSTPPCAGPTGSRRRSSSPGTTGAASTTTSCRRRVDAERLRPARPRARHQPVRTQGYIDHQTLSFDAYVKFIEDDFLDGQRLDPKTDGRPDPRPDVRERARRPRQPREGFRLHPKTSTAHDPERAPTHRSALNPPVRADQRALSALAATWLGVAHECFDFIEPREPGLAQGQLAGMRRFQVGTTPSCCMKLN